AEGMRIHPRLKQYSPHTGEFMEKWLLRAVADGLLPDEIVWRKKAQFDEGTGMSTLLPQVAEAQGMTEDEWYHGLLDKGFERPDQVRSVAPNWADARV